MARRKNPYHVVALKNYDFKDFKAVKSSQTKATKTEQGTRLKWTSMKWMRFLKNEPDACFFKYKVVLLDKGNYYEGKGDTP
ncbi:hypothetical protein MAR_004342 [Mya arenaria]|uniref:Uncharacterized protein n=1 Tax=Mya arenaria TaxID=6604 RepID=A0ABY7EY47_MYAAR|nr:hypothetical protein MAR_004342 [Mya arenaria]